MYEAQYRLSRRPFSPTPDPACYVPLDTFDSALAQLQRCVREGQGIGILTAAPGLGKTLLCQRLAVDLDDEFAVVFLPNANYPTRRSLLQAVLYELGHPYVRMGEQELRLELTTAVRELRGDSEAMVLIVDEAHLLNNRLLEEIRTITHLAVGGLPLVRVVLSAHLVLEERLTQPELEALNQRVACHVSLEPLTQVESKTYLAERLRWAGAELQDVFTPEAVTDICRASDGVPRCLNQLGDHSLLLGAAAEEQPIGPVTVLEALEELKQLPLLWNDIGPLPTPAETLRQQLDAQDSAFDEECPTSVDEAEPAAVAEVGCVEFGAAEPLAVVAWPETDEPTTETEEFVLSFDESDCSDKPEEADDAATIPVWTSAAATDDVARIRREIVAPDWVLESEPVIDRSVQWTLDQPLSVEWTTTADCHSETFPEAELLAEELGFPQPDPSPFAERAWPVERIVDVPAAMPTVSADSVEFFDNPDLAERLDEVLPMLDSLVENLADESGMPDEPRPTIFQTTDEATAWPQGAAQYSTIVPDAGETSSLGSVLAGALDPSDLETQIGALVLDTCLEAQQELYGRPRNRAVDQALAAALQEAIERASRGRDVSDDWPRGSSADRYDVIEPVEDSYEPAPRETASGAEPRKYRRLFTELRQRTQKTT